MEAVVYWYRTVRDADGPGAVHLEPELIHNKSEAGSEVKAIDFNRDGAMNFVSSGTHETFIFWGRPGDGWRLVSGTAARTTGTVIRPDAL